MKRITALATASALALTGLVALAPAASAKDGDLKARGACTSPSTSSWAVKVKPRKGNLRADFWVKNNTVGGAWTFTVQQGTGPASAPVTKTAGASDDQGVDDTRHAAEVKFRTYLPATAGVLTFTAISATGEECTVQLPR